jgi:hypothetical protein
MARVLAIPVYLAYGEQGLFLGQQDYFCIALYEGLPPDSSDRTVVINWHCFDEFSRQCLIMTLPR